MPRHPLRQRARKLELADASPLNMRCREEALLAGGFRLVAGVDEAGRGCLAGPVVAAAVILPAGCHLQGLKDSKQLTPRQRELFFDLIRSTAEAYATGVVGPEEIDASDILRASLEAMRMAVEALPLQPECLLIDGPFGIDHPLPQRPLVKGDQLSLSIAAASVIAKVSRDRMMCELERDYPSFRFSTHKGYGTARHVEEIRRHGLTPIHRKTFRVTDHWGQTSTY